MSVPIVRSGNTDTHLPTSHGREFTEQMSMAYHSALFKKIKNEFSNTMFFKSFRTSSGYF